MPSIGVPAGTATSHGDERADVELRLPADSAYASVLRTTTAGLAARLDFPIDDIEDLRIAVGEASALVLPEAREGADLSCRFYMHPGVLTVWIGVDVDHVVEPDEDSFAWQVLTTLASSATAETTDGVYAVVVSMESGLPEAGF